MLPGTALPCAWPCSCRGRGGASRSQRAAALSACQGRPGSLIVPLPPGGELTWTCSLGCELVFRPFPPCRVFRLLPECQRCALGYRRAGSCLALCLPSPPGQRPVHHIPAAAGPPPCAPQAPAAGGGLQALPASKELFSPQTHPGVRLGGVWGLQEFRPEPKAGVGWHKTGDRALAAAPGFVLGFRGCFLLADLAVFGKATGQDGQCGGVVPCSDTAGAELLHCVCRGLPVTNPLKHKSELQGVPVLCGCRREAQGKRDGEGKARPPPGLRQPPSPRCWTRSLAFGPLAVEESAELFPSKLLSFRCSAHERSSQAVPRGFSPAASQLCEARRQSAEPGSLSEALEAPNLICSSRREQSGAEPPRRGDGHLLGRPRKVLARRGAGSQAAPGAATRESRDQCTVTVGRDLWKPF